MINNNYVKSVYENLCSKYSHEKEFLQAVQEVLPAGSEATEATIEDRRFIRQ